MNENQNKKIGILTSGGDCPGLNAVIRAVVKASKLKGWDVYGIPSRDTTVLCRLPRENITPKI
jgi:hypothetical protein